MMPILSRILRSGTLLAGLAGAALTAQAGVSVGVSVGLPVITPVGGVSIGVRGGHGYGHGHGYVRGGWWGPVVVSPWWYWPTGVVVVTQPTPAQAASDAAPPPAATPAAPIAPAKPEPIIYPRNGQSPQQTEADRQECNRWATTQPAAMAEASAFQRAVEACMDGRGYTMR